jgi:hypothetical protein
MASTQPPVKWIPGTPSRVLKQPEREAGNPISEVFTSGPPIRPHGALFRSKATQKLNVLERHFNNFSSTRQSGYFKPIYTLPKGSI